MVGGDPWKQYGNLYSVADTAKATRYRCLECVCYVRLSEDPKLQQQFEDGKPAFRRHVDQVIEDDEVCHKSRKEN